MFTGCKFVRNVRVALIFMTMFVDSLRLVAITPAYSSKSSQTLSSITTKLRQTTLGTTTVVLRVDSIDQCISYLRGIDGDSAQDVRVNCPEVLSYIHEGRELPSELQRSVGGFHFKEFALLSSEGLCGEVVEYFKERRWGVSFSSHSVESYDSCYSRLEASELEPDFFLVGTMYETKSHPEKGANVEGIELLRSVRRLHDDRQRGAEIVGIGGIDVEGGKVGGVLGAGGDGVAVIGALFGAEDSCEMLERLWGKMWD